MKEKSAVKSVYYFAIALVAMAAVIGIWSTQAKQKEDREELKARVRAALGSEVKFAGRGAGLEEIVDSVESASAFIQNRSGLKLDDAVKRRLVDEERRFLSDEIKGIQVQSIGPSLTAAALERAAALTDRQLAYAADSLCGFKAPDLPHSFGRGRLRIRAGKAIGPKPEEFIAQAKALRGSDADKVVLFKINDFINKDVQKRIDVYREALPGFLVNRGGKEHLSPLRAFLIVYSEASDDFLSPTTAVLKKQMADFHQVGQKTAGYYPAPDGYFAYGPNGYLYSSPIDLLFDAETAIRVIDNLLGKEAKR